MNVGISEIKIPFELKLLKRWKARDLEIVPESCLIWNGPGISNGYGFGEWMAEKFFIEKGYKVINNEFNIVAKKSKYKENNTLIKRLIGKERVLEFSQKIRDLNERGCKVVSHLDLFIYNDKEYFFAEVKKEQDKLRQEQIRFIELAKTILKINTYLIYLDDQIKEPVTKTLNFNLEGYHD
jgi:hypothetical protein